MEESNYDFICRISGFQKKYFDHIINRDLENMYIRGYFTKPIQESLFYLDTYPCLPATPVKYKGKHIGYVPTFSKN